ncbi:uncharacterized protein LOC133839552 isoform X1 [Drosophila sulfurigaster albostrigata]|uniref:uncharacterized protein LOC133839552 isoform X1 n=1 Tax=Drosophila sulfurigaster albostrigata TaxID=89887 RepID=UPI002D21E704|nr:uncharacterized protein LOC133839552 isoform X1 [Drosophila sulfurigaster albostrigata]
MNMKCNCGESSGRPVMNEAVTLLRLLHKSDNQKEKRRTRKQPTAGENMDIGMASSASASASPSPIDFHLAQNMQHTSAVNRLRQPQQQQHAAAKHTLEVAPQSSKPPPPPLHTINNM